MVISLLGPPPPSPLSAHHPLRGYPLTEEEARRAENSSQQLGEGEPVTGSGYQTPLSQQFLGEGLGGEGQRYLLLPSTLVCTVAALLPGFTSAVLLLAVAVLLMAEFPFW